MNTKKYKGRAAVYLRKSSLDGRFTNRSFTVNEGGLRFASKSLRKVEIMALYMIHWKLRPDAKMDAATNFGQMTEADDDADSGDVEMLGRWHDFAGEQGWAICDSPTPTDVQAWLFNWAPLISSTITPVQTDAEIRAMFQAKLA